MTPEDRIARARDHDAARALKLATPPDAIAMPMLNTDVRVKSLNVVAAEEENFLTKEPVADVALTGLQAQAVALPNNSFKTEITDHPPVIKIDVEHPENGQRVTGLDSSVELTSEVRTFDPANVIIPVEPTPSLPTAENHVPDVETINKQEILEHKASEEPRDLRLDTTSEFTTGLNVAAPADHEFQPLDWEAAHGVPADANSAPDPEKVVVETTGPATPAKALRGQTSSIVQIDELGYFEEKGAVKPEPISDVEIDQTLDILRKEPAETAPEPTVPPVAPTKKLEPAGAPNSRYAKFSRNNSGSRK